ncbi:MAG: helix-turn-helix domain-containing protein [Chloroflexota bacterium]|nr:helix-turn-helix domain-containing protein [Chloroflexota bacterium]
MPDRQRRRAGASRIEGQARALRVVRRVGVGLRESRVASGLTQAEAAERAGVSQPFWSRVERGLTTAPSIETLASCAAAVGVQLAAFIEARPGSDLPRDIEHLRRQELVIAVARTGGWIGQPEFGIDPGAMRSRSIDVLLRRTRAAEIAVVEIEDLLADGGGAMRGLADKVTAVRRTSVADGRVAGLLVLRATARNRGTMQELDAVFANRFPASSADWLRALADPRSPMPAGDGIVWSSVDGTRLMAVRRRSPT